MRLALACASALAVFVGTSNAAVLTVNTTEHPLGPTSNIDININILGLQNITINNIGLSGNAPADFILDGSNSGSIQVLPGGAINLADVSQGFAGIFLSGSVQTIGVGAELTMGPESVTNRNFTIDSSTAGGLNLNAGFINLTVTGGALAGALTAALGTNVVALDLAADPLAVQFADLGTTSVAATTDDDGTGLNTNLPSGHEINIPLNFTTTLDLEGVALTVTTTGDLYLGKNTVPEFGSIGLMALAVAGMGGVVAARRRRKA